MVRYGANGSLVLEGRKDTQVKIRGQRVEISEVEYQLGKLFPNASGVAVVFSRREETSELIAMVSCGAIWDTTAESHGLLPQLADASISTLSDIKAKLGETLPRHMVPARCVLVPDLPILPNVTAKDYSRSWTQMYLIMSSMSSASPYHILSHIIALPSKSATSLSTCQ